ncbi:MAG: hypothetical protein AAGF23_17210 [Acidobacteriota bacterium]
MTAPDRPGAVRRAARWLRRTASTVRLDVRLLWRNKIYTVSLIVSALLGVALRVFFDPGQAAWALPVIYLLIVGASTYFIGAAMVLLEKSQGTLAALRTSPLRPGSYLVAKMLSLGSLLAAECAVLYLVGFGGAEAGARVERWWSLGLGLVLLCALQTAIGLGQVAPHRSVTSFLVPGAALIGSVLQLPVFFVMEAGPPWLWYLIPTHGAFLLILGAWRDLEAWQWLYAAGLGTVAALWSIRWARRRLEKHVGWMRR